MVKKYSITKFANLTGLNKETIRFYRTKGILNPIQDPNNSYFYYTYNDLVSLFYVRRQRDISIPLSTIQSDIDKKEIDYDWIQERLNQALEERVRLDQQIEWLQFSLQYYNSTKTNFSGVKEIQVQQDKYDFPIFDAKSEIQISDCINQLNHYALSICIDKEDLLSTKEELPLHIKMCLLEKSLSSTEITLPKTHTYLPKGSYLFIIFPITQFETISRKQIQPLLDYAKQNHFEILSDVTSHLLNIKKDNTQTEYYLRFRVYVRKLENVVDNSL